MMALATRTVPMTITGDRTTAVPALQQGGLEARHELDRFVHLECRRRTRVQQRLGSGRIRGIRRAFSRAGRGAQEQERNERNYSHQG